MKKHLPRKLAVVAIAFVATSGSLAAAHLTGLTLFGITLGSNQVVSVAPTTGAAVVVGSLGATSSAYGIASRNSKLYTFDQVSNRIREINKISGGVSRTIDIGVSGLKGEGDLAFRPSDGVGFLVSALNASDQPVNDFYTFVITDNTTVGTSARLGSTGVAIDGLAFDSAGTLYGLGQADATLYTINQTTGAATAVGSLGVPVNSPIAGMTFGRPDPPSFPNGELYAAIDDRLFKINTATGAATVVSADVLNFSPLITSVSGLVFATGAGTLGNMSGRVGVGVDERVAITGFIISGTPEKRVLARGIGPSMTTVSGVLADPVLELFNSQGQMIARNDDFSSNSAADQAEIQALGLTPANSKESALIRTLPAGSYTAILRGANRTTGIGLVELYDAALGSGSRLGNLSTRGFVQPGDSTLIGGIIVKGSATQRVVVRVLGPSLADFGVPAASVLADPNVEIFDANGTSIKKNDNHTMDPDAAEISAQRLAPSRGLEAATIVTLAPGSYTAIVRGAGTGTGVALVESFNLTTANE